MSQPVPIHRAPMRARDRDDVPTGAGAEYGLNHGLVGIGERLDEPPETLDEAVAFTADRFGDKAGRMLARFAELREGSLVWTRDRQDRYHLGRITGPWRYDASADAEQVGIHHVRPTRWLKRSFTADQVPAAVAATFERGGRNFQRTHDADAGRDTSRLWAEHAEDA